MKRKISGRYKGVAIFGAPGSGKTTLARSLLAAFPAGKYVEAFRCVIGPASSVKDRLPPEEGAFIRLIGKIRGRAAAKRIPREEARRLFTHLKNKYSPAVVARTLIHLHRKKFPRNFLIIAGIRGYRNAVRLKKNGYLVVYLRTPDKHRVSRLAKRESFSRGAAEREKEIEERLFSTNKVERIARLSFDTVLAGKKEMIGRIKALAESVECRRCVNSSASLGSPIGRSGLCEICEKYGNNFDKARLAKERKFLLSLKNTGRGRYDVMVGISGGKDSAAVLYEVKEMGFTPLAFSFDTGYYPDHIFRRAKQAAKKLDIDHQKIDVRKYIRPADRLSYGKTADLYGERESEELREKFRKWYAEGRRHYSIKCRHSLPFVRTCQLCRRVVIRAYYGEALKRGVRAVILGINEWAGLSQDAESRKFVFSAIRKLKPFKNRPPVYVVHLPFLLQRKIADTGKILGKLGWKAPRGESLIESNANSCLFARAAENKARRLLGFHPDTTRLAREVTVGFITKKQARRALAKAHNYRYSVRTVLRRAKII